MLIKTTNLPPTPPKDRVPALYRGGVRILGDLDYRARVAIAAKPDEKLDALKALRQTRDSFIVFATTAKHSHAVNYFKHMDRWADWFMLGDTRLARIIDDAGSKVARAFTAAVYILERDIPTVSATSFSSPRLRIDVRGPGEAPPRCTLYAADIDAARIVTQACFAFINTPRDWYKTRDFAWFETGEQLYLTALGVSDEMLARRFGCKKSLIRQRRKRGWDCIENSLAYFGIIEPPDPNRTEKSQKRPGAVTR